MVKNQKGFSAVEIFAVLVVVSLLGFGGWYVWQRINPASNSEGTGRSEDSTKNAGRPANDSENKAGVNSVRDGWKQYSDNRYTFIYPDNWVTVSPEQKESILLKSPDYEEARLVEAQRPYYVTSNGYQLEISKIPDGTPNETLEKLTAHIVNEEQQLGGGSQKDITVDGHQGLWVNNKHEDTYIYAVVFHNGERTHLQLNTKDDSDPTNTKLFDDLLAGFKIK